MGIVTVPAPLDGSHKTVVFDCGNDTLNDWLKNRALKNQESGASRTFVVCQNDRVVGYYALASGSVERMEVPKSIARNMPEPIPVMVLGRLAIDTSMHGQRIGSSLLKDALLRTLKVSQDIGVRAVLVHAISEDAKHFYQAYGFQVSPIDPMTLMLPIRHIGPLL
jgi:predicted GNAT family N-acyltransferase